MHSAATEKDSTESEVDKTKKSTDIERKTVPAPYVPDIWAPDIKSSKTDFDDYYV